MDALSAVGGFLALASFFVYATSEMNDRWGCLDPLAESIRGLDGQLHDRLMASPHFRTLLPPDDADAPLGGPDSAADAEAALRDTLLRVQSSGARLPRRLRASAGPSARNALGTAGDGSTRGTPLAAPAGRAGAAADDLGEPL
jgi:hypothetical protein